MQQQQLAAQLAHHGNSARQPPLSPTPSDSDSDISLGAHSPPISSPGPIRFGASSPTPITSFRFGPHSPGPMPAQFRFNNHTPPNFRLQDNRQSPTPPHFRKLRSSDSPISVDTTTSNYNSVVNLRLTESPIDVDSNNEYSRQEKSSSPIRVDNSPTPQTTLQHSPHMNLRIADNLRAPDNTKIETPLPLRLGPHQLTAPLRIQVSSPNRMGLLPSQHTTLGGTPHGGIVRIAPQSPSNNPPFRPFSPPRLT